jgi:class 3 adenylate cyclase/pimeloyl-ACP methyl ester carboxylesterase
MAPEIRYARTTDGVNIAYVALGRGPVLLDLPTPPFDDTEKSWEIADYREGFEAVAKALTLVRYDARGFGSSDRNVTDFSLEAMVRDMEAVVAAVGAARFAISAWSEATVPALAFAAQHPDAVICMALREAMASGVYTSDDTILALARENWPAAQRMLADALPNVGTVASLRQMEGLIHHTTTQEGYIRFREGVATWDATPVLSSVSVPTIITHDGWSRVPPEVSRELAATLPDASYVRHSTPRGEPSPSEGAVSEFFARKFAAEYGMSRPPRAPDRDSASETTQPGGLRTILFTDLVGHTEMMRRLGDERGREVLREHERITRELLREYGGAEVKTMGDGFMASFGSVTKAMDCAIALQRAFAAWNEGDGAKASSLHVRVGLNAGEPIEENGDLFGSTVIMASRVAAQAGPGEILIPEPLRHLLTGKAYVYADRGETMLKGFEDAVRLYEVRWED